MEENGTMTIRDLLELTMKELEGINVPILYADTIARPLWNATQNLKTCIEAIPDRPPEEVTEDVQG